MNHCEGVLPRAGRAVLPSSSGRCLQHPSLMPVYMAADPHRQSNPQTVHPIIPSEVFYTDPSDGLGRRIPNVVSQLRTLDHFQLNTPAPLMSSCMTPQNHLDSFRSWPHPITNLGSPTWRIHTIRMPVQPGQVVLQLTPVEDQAITNLLKLHYQEPTQSEGKPIDLSTATAATAVSCTDDHMDSASADKPLGKQFAKARQKRHWSDVEVEAAHTLLNLSDMRGSKPNTPPGPAASKPDENGVQYPTRVRLHQEGNWCDSQLNAAQTLLRVQTDFTSKATPPGPYSSASVSPVGENPDVSMEGWNGESTEASLSPDSKETSLHRADAKKQRLSNYERNAAQVLLFLRHNPD